MGRIVEEMKYMQTNTYCLHVSRDELEALYFKASCVSVTIEQLLKDIIEVPLRMAQMNVCMQIFGTHVGELKHILIIFQTPASI